jgi:hypothetical protein
MANTTNFNWETPDDTDLVKDGAAAMRTLGNSIDTSFVDLKGGTTGQILSKASNTDLDYTWVTTDDANAIQNAIVDAKGDLIAATAADTPARLAVGTNGQVLTADSTAATGLKWATPAAGGKVLQVVTATSTSNTAVATTTYTDTGLSASITPSSASSRILVLVNQNSRCFREVSTSGFGIKLLRGATEIVDQSNGGNNQWTLSVSASPTGTPSLVINANVPLMYVDSPSTTSATTYKTQGAVQSAANGGSVTFNTVMSTITLLEIGA